MEKVSTQNQPVFLVLIGSLLFNINFERCYLGKCVSYIKYRNSVKRLDDKGMK